MTNIIMTPQQLRQLFIETAETKGLPHARFNETYWQASLDAYRHGAYDDAIAATANIVMIVEPTSPEAEGSTVTIIAPPQPAPTDLSASRDDPPTEEEEDAESLNHNTFYNLSKLHFNLGMLNRGRGDYRRALKYFTISQERDKYFAISFFMRGVCYQEMGFDWPRSKNSVEKRVGDLVGEARTLVECAVLDYTKTLELLQGKVKIDYHQLGLPFMLRVDEVLHNRAQCFKRLGMYHRARDDITKAQGINNNYHFPIGGVEERFQKKKQDAYEEFLRDVNDRLVFAPVTTLIHPWKPPPPSTIIPEGNDNPPKATASSLPTLKAWGEGKGKEKETEKEREKGKEKEKEAENIPASVLQLRRQQSQRILEAMEAEKAREKEKEKEKEKEEKEKEKDRNTKIGNMWGNLRTSLARNKPKEGPEVGAGGSGVSIGGGGVGARAPAGGGGSVGGGVGGSASGALQKEDSFIFSEWGLHNAGEDKVEAFLARISNRPSFKQLRESGILPTGLVEKELEEQQVQVLREQKAHGHPPSRKPPPLPTGPRPVRPPRMLPVKQPAPVVELVALNNNN